MLEIASKKLKVDVVYRGSYSASDEVLSYWVL